MRVTVVRSGGIAGMVTTTTVDTALLPGDAVEELHAAVAACSFSPPGRAWPPAADGFAYEVVVTGDDGSEQRVRFPQGGAPTGAGELVRWVDDCPQARREVGR